MIKALFTANISRLMLAFLAGGVASLALPPIGFFVGILALGLPFFMLSQVAEKKMAFALGWASGFGWFSFSFYWLAFPFIVVGEYYVLLIPFAVVGLPMVFALFWGAAFVGTMWCKTPSVRVLFAVILLVLVEYARGIIATGFPWNVPGMIFTTYENTLALASIFGVWGLTLFALSIAAVPALFCLGYKRGGKRSDKMLAMLLVLLLAGLMLGGGIYQGGQIEYASPANTMTVRLVQPNVPQREKWLRQERPRHLHDLIILSRQEALSQGEQIRPDVIIWPETAFAGALENETQLFNSIIGAASNGQTPIITGMLRSQSTVRPKISNSMALVAPDGTINGLYDKNRLVPFGEYAPLREFIPFIDVIAGEVDFFAGQSRPALILERDDGRQVRILPLICYEIIFPADVRQSWQKAKADIITIISNDAWFGDTVASYQHLATAQMRASELGTPVIFSANTGVSAFVDAKGNIVNHLDYGEKGIVDVQVGTSITTVYGRIGDNFFFLLIALWSFIALLIQYLTRRNL